MISLEYFLLLLFQALFCLCILKADSPLSVPSGGNDLFSQFFAKQQAQGVSQVSNAIWLPANHSTTTAISSERRRGALVFIYTVSKNCPSVFPPFIVSSIVQAIRSQPHLDIILLSNFNDCRVIFETVKNIKSLYLVDTTKLQSPMTRDYEKSADAFFYRDEKLHFLWTSSASRFFYLRDFMTTYHYEEILHIEADNLLYHPFSDELLKTLRQSYPLAGVPLSANKAFLSAAVFWVSQPRYLIDLTDYLLLIVKKQGSVWTGYLQFLKRWFCCKQGGFEADPSTGKGIKPFGVNEMSMLAYYRLQHPDLLKVLPVVPSYPSYPKKRAFLNLTHYSPGGRDVGPPTLHLLWDAGPYGQYLGGTKVKKGQDINSFDLAQVGGQAIAVAKCKVRFLCVKNATSFQEIDSQLFTPWNPAIITLAETCYSAPLIRCPRAPTAIATAALSASNRIEDPGLVAPWIPLMNLHIHSKRLASFVSSTCPCS